MKNFAAGIFVAAAIALFFLAQWGDSLKASATQAQPLPMQVQVIDKGVQLVETAVSQSAPINMIGQPVQVQPTAQPSPTPYFAPATAMPQFSPQFLADCAFAQSSGRRSHPNCPTNAAEMLGGGR